MSDLLFLRPPVSRLWGARLSRAGKGRRCSEQANHRTSHAWCIGPSPHNILISRVISLGHSPRDEDTYDRDVWELSNEN